MSTTTYLPSGDQSFKTTSPGLALSVLRRHDDGAGVTLLFHMKKGAHAPHHGHPGGEEVYLVSGKLRVGQTTLSPGDYLFTAPGESHDGFAEEESVFFVVLPGGLDLAEAPPARETA